MPLPLPNLDTRRWADLVEEGRALIPQFAPDWTDHNVHDPGITLIELFAYVVEGLLYRANRIPERHRRKFMALAGYTAHPPRPAQGVVQARLVSGTSRLDLPGGLIVSAAADQGEIGFSLIEAATFLEARLRSVLVFDGTTFTDRTRPALGQVAFPVFGTDPVASSDPERSPALYLGFDRALLPHVPLGLAFFWDGADDDDEAGIQAEGDDACRQPPPGFACRPCRPDSWCGQLTRDEDSALAGAGAPALLRHHSARLVWEYRALDQWQELLPTEVHDPTRSLTRNGIVQVRIPGPMAAVSVGPFGEARYWLRCRFVAGEFDEAPVACGVLENAAAVGQQIPCTQTFEVAPGAVMTAPPIGQPGPLHLAFDGHEQIARLEPAPADGRPLVRVLEFTPPTATTPWVVTLAIEHPLTGAGEPSCRFGVRQPEVANGMIEVMTLEGTGWRAWDQRGDLDASGPHDRHYMLDPTAGEVRFGDGARGVVVPDGAPVLVRYAATHGREGNLRDGLSWTIADNPWNRALLGPALTVSTAAARLATLRNPLSVRGGADEESLESVERRAAESLWSHERLTQLVPAAEPPTLDQVGHHPILSRPAPARATTVADYERLALAVPGTRLKRTRAWANLDPTFPDMEASGTVTVVIVPGLPRGRPQPGRALLRRVRRFLERRRVLGTRLLVVGPRYLTVEVRARIRAHRNADVDVVRGRVETALATFLDPLTGGPDRCGWPFGRDVYRSEIMAVIDGVPGVDHVEECTLVGDGRAVACGNLCVAPTSLVASGPHSIVMERS